MRPLGIPTVVDRFVQQAIAQVLTVVYEPQFSDDSFGFRPGRSAHDALRRVQEYADAGYRYCVDLDLASYFDSVNHSKLIQVLSETVKDGRVKALAGGEADIYCLAADGSGVRAVCHVNVSEQIKSLQAAEKKHSMTVGETWQPEIIIQPETATNRIVVWNSSDESVCTVDETGLVTAVGKGKCVISCAATDGSKKTVKINVTVTE